MAWSPPGRGALKHRVRFEIRPPAVNVGGVVQAQAWETAIGSRRARLLVVRGGETAQAARLSGQAILELTLPNDRAVAMVTTDHRVVDARDGRAFDIRSVIDPIGDGRWLVMTLEENRGDGRKA